MDDETAHLMSYLPVPTDPRDAEIARLKALLRVVHLDWAIHRSLAPGTVERVAAVAPPPA